jgi:hypothetical protein
MEHDMSGIPARAGLAGSLAAALMVAVLTKAVDARLRAQAPERLGQ